MSYVHTITCLFCDGLYTIDRPSRLGKSKYCSRECKDEHRKYLLGPDSFRWNSSKKNCLECGNEIFVKKSAFDTVKYCSNECRHKANSKRVSGKGNCFYIDGRHLNGDTYPKEFNTVLKEKIRKRFKNRCALCGKHQKYQETKFDVHHIDHNKHNQNEGNLIPVCDSCHRWVHNLRFQLIKEWNLWEDQPDEIHWDRSWKERFSISN